MDAATRLVGLRRRFRVYALLLTALALVGATRGMSGHPLGWLVFVLGAFGLHGALRVIATAKHQLRLLADLEGARRG